MLASHVACPGFLEGSGDECCSLSPLILREHRLLSSSLIHESLRFEIPLLSTIVCSAFDGESSIIEPSSINRDETIGRESDDEAGES